MAGSFSMQLNAFKAKSEKQVVLGCQKIAMEVWKRVILRSPVDTGRFRANWGVSIGSPYSGTVNVFDESGQGTIVLATKATQAWTAKMPIYLCNNLSYSIPLERGHSGQAPLGMVRVSVAEMANGGGEAAAK